MSLMQVAVLGEAAVLVLALAVALIGRRVALTRRRWAAEDAELDAAGSVGAYLGLDVYASEMVPRGQMVVVSPGALYAEPVVIDRLNASYAAAVERGEAALWRAWFPCAPPHSFGPADPGVSR